MKAYLINRDCAGDRLAMQTRQFAERGIEFVRVAACEDAKRNAFRWWCAVLRPPVKGELGCVASHCECYRRIVESGDNCAVVFEDDVKMNNGVKSALEMAEAECARDPQAVVLLGLHHKTKAGDDFSQKVSALRIEKETWDHCAEAYVIGREAARTLMEKQSPVRLPSDWWGYECRKGWVHLMRVVPSVCGQATDKFESSLGERFVAAEHGLCARIWWKVRRVVGVAIDTLLDGRRGW